MITFYSYKISNTLDKNNKVYKKIFQIKFDSTYLIYGSFLLFLILYLLSCSFAILLKYMYFFIFSERGWVFKMKLSLVFELLLIFVLIAFAASKNIGKKEQFNNAGF